MLFTVRKCMICIWRVRARILFYRRKHIFLSTLSPLVLTGVVELFHTEHLSAVVTVLRTAQGR